MNVYVVVAGFHYEGEQALLVLAHFEQALASFTDSKQAEQFRDYLEMSQKLGQAVAGTDGYDYFWVNTVPVSNTWEDAVNRLEQEREDYNQMLEDERQERFQELQDQQPTQPTLADVFPTQ